jgi:tetratricopeptide (TPR) repeat protein
MKKILAIFFLLFVCATAFSQVKMSEETMTLPTYETKSPDKIPLFFRSEEVQLAERHIYPYPFIDVQSTPSVDKDYVAVILENEYLKICVTPEMGGRVYYALDKTNGYEIVYNNRVVKPALIGTIGAWTSGGTEWNTPHHHRATSLLPVDYRLVENADGSKTVWVGEYEKRSQTRWLVGLTLEPGKAYLKQEFKSLNVTPFQYPALFFANNAVHVNDDYQFIFPPDVEMMNFHYVTEFTRWPILNQVYQSYDYSHGEDLSWWKTVKQPTSFFVTKSHQDFMGGIDHGKKAGIALVGDHQIFKGKKLWNWGKNEVQEAWDQKLTDDDGPYAELMMGFYSDNQPDYNFLAPFETKYGTTYLYGIKNLHDMKEVSKDFALNMELNDGTVLVQINSTSVQKQVKVLLMLKEKVIFEETVDMSPVKAYEKSIDVNSKDSFKDLKLAVVSKDGAELISWQKQPALNEPFPEIYKDPLDPREYKTSQELFFVGLKIEQFGNTNFDYMKYYKAALKIDPNDVLTNTQIGTVYLKRREYEKAEQHLKRAVAVVTGNHKKAGDATSLYYLGVCFFKQGKIEQALDMLNRCTWAYEWTSAGYTLAAQIEASQKDWERALDAADRACKANTQNVDALATKAIILRQMGDYENAQRTAEYALSVDPLCFVAMNELRLLTGNVTVGNEFSELQTLKKHLRNEPYNYIETATRYSEMGLFKEAAELMAVAAESDEIELSAYPMVHYHLGMYLALAGEKEKATEELQKASELSTDLCFPYGDESVKALKQAISKNANDATACYLLGNALADYQHEEAVKYWQMAAESMDKESLIYRNIAYIQANHLRDMPNALSNIMKAISLDPTEPRYFREANLYMSYASLTPQQLADFLNEYGSLGKDIVDIQLMEIKLHNFKGEYDRALHLLEKMNYHIEEGATFNPHVLWFDANLQAGVHFMRAKKYEDAEKSFLQAMEFPINLEAERDGKIGIAYFYLGMNAQLRGETKKAHSYFQKMIDYTYNQGWGAGDFPELDYYRALASKELGQDQTVADGYFQKLIDDGLERVNPKQDSRHITVTVDESHSGRIFLLEKELRRKGLLVSSYYMRGLGHVGLGENEKARSMFEKALKVDPLYLDAKLMLTGM